MNWIPEWLRAPVFEDMEKTRKSSLLHVILVFSLLVLIANGLVAFVTLPDYGMIYVLINFVTGCAVAIFYWLNQRGNVDLSIWLTTFSFWLAMAGGIFSFVGIYDPYIESFIFVIIMASLLINSMVSFTYTALTIALGFIWIAFQPPPHLEAITVWLAHCFILTLTAFLMWLAQRGIRRVVMQLQEQEQQLQHKNKALMREIADRIQAEMELQQHEIQSRQLLDMTPIAVAVVDENASLLYLNPRGVQLAGAANTQKLIGTSLYTFFPELQSSTLMHPKPIQHTITTHDKQQLDIEVRSVPFDFQQKQAYLLLITDITAQRRMEQDRIEAEKLRIQMEEERKVLQLRDSFAAMVSHEFRTPLTVIQSSRDILAKYRDRLTDEKREELLSRIDRQVKRMTQLLEDILVFSQFDAGIKRPKLESFHLDLFWKNLIDELRLVYPEHQFETEFESSDVMGSWDDGLLRHVLINLMSNAAKYSSVGSAVSCYLHYDHDKAVLQVHDRGRGIPIHDQPKIFQPFMRASNTDKSDGTGLGLVIVKQSVEAQGGRIQFESVENEGTIFTVQLPFVPAPLSAKPAN